MGVNVEIYTGCMASGKSRAIIERADELEQTGLSIACLKPDLEVRDNGIESRRGVRREAIAVPSLGKAALEGTVELSDAVVIDELFFFNGELLDDTISVVDRWQHENKKVVAAMLNYSAMGKPMTVYQAIVEKFDPEIITCHEAVCDYSHHPEPVEATRTQIVKRGCGTPIRSGLPELVPEDPSNPIDYKPVCYDCFYTA